MGRPGGGGGSHSGGSRSGGSHSSSRSSSSHRVGSSSSRPTGGSRPSSSSRGGGSYHHTPPPPPHGGYRRTPPPPRGGYYAGGSRRRSSGGGCSSLFATFAVFIILMVIVFAVLAGNGKSGSSGGGKVPQSSYNREKLNAGNGYINNCIIDELGWFDNESRTEGRLKSFYDKTGVQPYIILLKYNPTLTSDAAKEEYAKQLYDKYIDNEATFLYVYFAEMYETDDSEPGLMCHVNGKQVSSVMDSEAVDIFWAYIDKYWYSNMSTDDMFVKAFDSTADRIMTKSTTGKDIVKYVLIVAAAGVVVFGVISVVKLKHKRAKEEAEETERILNTPIESLIDKDLEDTAKKYDEAPKQ